VSSRAYRHVLNFATEHPWALTEPMLATIVSILENRLAGNVASDTEIEAALVNRRNLPQPNGDGAVATIPVYGVLVPRASMMTDMSGGTSFEKLTAQLREAMANPAVSTIVLDIDSPGGNVAGATEFARALMKARAKKPIIAQAQYTMASAAYWIAAACTEIVAAPSARVGSVGVYAIHKDLSEKQKAEGVKLTYISAGKHKVEGNDSEPLSDDALASIQAMVDESYGQFVADVAKGRGISVDAVKSGYGEGRVVGSAEAKSLGMVDRIATLEETISRVLTTDAAGGGPARAALTPSTTESPASSPATDPVGVSDLDLERALFELTLSLT